MVSTLNNFPETLRKEPAGDPQVLNQQVRARGFKQ